MSYRRLNRSTKQSYSEDVYLITYEDVENDFGEVIEGAEIKRLVMARQTEVSRNDFWQSRISGLKPTLSLEMKNIEYQGELVLEFNGELYNVLKTYLLNQDVELTCEKVIYG